MNKLMCLVGALGAIAATAMFHLSEAQTVHVVGDTVGWRVPTDPTLYTTWAAGKNFAVGDTLVFSFTPDRHDVQEVEKASFDACSISTNAIGQPIMTSPANITLNSIGQHYYICTFNGHCQGGQKLAITVSASSDDGATPPTSGSTTPTATPPPPSGGSSGIAAFSSLLLTSLSIALTFFY